MNTSSHQLCTQQTTLALHTRYLAYETTDSLPYLTRHAIVGDLDVGQAHFDAIARLLQLMELLIEHSRRVLGGDALGAIVSDLHRTEARKADVRLVELSHEMKILQEHLEPLQLVVEMHVQSRVGRGALRVQIVHPCLSYTPVTRQHGSFVGSQRTQVVVGVRPRVDERCIERLLQQQRQEIVVKLVGSVEFGPYAFVHKKR